MKIVNSNLLDETNGIIVHGCNMQGVMNSGIAGQIKAIYPQVYNDYINQYKTKQLGDIIITNITNELIIVSGLTQEYYGRNKSIRYVDYKAIENVFIKVNQLAIDTKLPIKYPMIGCGLANGDWDIVSNIINTTIDADNINIVFVL